MPDPLLVFHLFSRHSQRFGVLDNDIIAAVAYWMVNGFVLALEEGSDAGR